MYCALAPDGEPKITSVVPESSESVRIQWKAVPADDQNGIIIQHEIEIRKKQGRDSFGKEDVKTTNKSDTFLATELKPFTDYQFRVRAYTVVGPGDYSSPHTTRTPEDGMSSHSDLGVCKNSELLWCCLQLLLTHLPTQESQLSIQHLSW